MTAIVAWAAAHPRLAGAATVLVAAVLLAVSGYAVKHRIDALRAQRDNAMVESRRLSGELSAVRKNAMMNVGLVVAKLRREREKAPKVQEIIRRVYIPRKPMPRDCYRVLDPISGALDGVRELRSADGGSPTPTDPRVQAGPRASGPPGARRGGGGS